jgi:hypothetical protein
MDLRATRLFAATGTVVEQRVVADAPDLLLVLLVRKIVTQSKAE